MLLALFEVNLVTYTRSVLLSVTIVHGLVYHGFLPFLRYEFFFWYLQSAMSFFFVSTECHVIAAYMDTCGTEHSSAVLVDEDYILLSEIRTL